MIMMINFRKDIITTMIFFHSSNKNIYDYRIPSKKRKFKYKLYFKK